MKVFCRSSHTCFTENGWETLELDRGVLVTPEHYLADGEDVAQVQYPDIRGEEVARDWFIRVSSDKTFRGYLSKLPSRTSLYNANLSILSTWKPPSCTQSESCASTDTTDTQQTT